MASSRPPDLTIRSLRGGLNTDDPASELKPDQCTAAMNVEFHTVPCGERRRGCVSINQGAYANTYDAIVMVARHLPTDDETAAQLWFAGAVGGVTSFRYKDTAWNAVSPVDAVDNSNDIYAMRAVSFHNKLYVTYNSPVDRLHVWDGTTLRRAGIAAPSAAPTAVDQNIGTLSGTRYYRVRWLVQVAGVTIRRSEPSAVLEFTPSGAGGSVLITAPTTAGADSPTHWEIEASLDNATFYTAHTFLAVSSTTVNDNVPYSEGYTGGTSVHAGGGRLSETSGDYTVPLSAKFLTVDDDRLVMASSFETTALTSRVSWTPVNGDPGVGNDERVPIATVNFLDLDAGQGGGITDMSQASNGFFYVFKWRAIYKMVRTGVRSQAYQASVVSKSLGAIPGSVVSGLDEFGRSCIYALDPSLGIYRIGANGLQLHHGLGSKVNTGSTWSTVNTDAATVLCCSVYYADAKQVKWFLATNGSDLPNLEVVLQTDATRVDDTGTGIEGGVSLANGQISNVISATMFAGNIDAGTARSKVLKPTVGTYGASATATIRQQDTGTTDDGTAYAATLTSAPVMAAGQLNRFGTLSAGLVAMAASAVTVVLGQSRDFGATEKTATIDLTPTASETEVIKTADNSGFASIRALQVSLSDASPATGRWQVVQIALSQSQQEKG